MAREIHSTPQHVDTPPKFWGYTIPQLAALALSAILTVMGLFLTPGGWPLPVKTSLVTPPIALILWYVWTQPENERFTERPRKWLKSLSRPRTYGVGGASRGPIVFKLLDGGPRDTDGEDF